MPHGRMKKELGMASRLGGQPLFLAHFLKQPILLSVPPPPSCPPSLPVLSMQVFLSDHLLIPVSTSIKHFCHAFFFSKIPGKW